MTTRGTTETLELILLPLPAEEMDAEGARAWLADEAAGWVSILGEEPQTLDFEASVHELARVASSMPRVHDAGEQWKRSQAALRVELLRRLDVLGT